MRVGECGISGVEYASRGLGRGDGNGELRSDGGKAFGIGGVPLSDGVGVAIRVNCHGAGEGRRMMVWLFLTRGDEAGEVFVRCRHRTSITSFSRLLAVSDVLLAISDDMRSAWSSSRMLSSVMGAGDCG